MSSSSSSSSLKSLIECTRLIVSDKVTDRKKQVDNLPFLLKNASVLEALDRNSSRRDGYTWDNLFDAVKICVSKEVEHLEKETQKIVKVPTSIATLSTRDHKKKMCSSIVRLVIHQANSRGEPRLKATKLVNYLLNAMHSEFTWNCFAVEYSNILLKEILSRRKIARDIPSAALNEFLVVYIEYYKASKSESIHGLVMQIMESIVRLSYFQTMLDPSPLFTFFKDTILHCRNNLGISQQESLMSACLSLCKVVAVDCRLQLCFFGESVFGTVLSMLEDKLSKHFKAILIDFLQLQLSCHHPNGVSREDEGMICCDETLWKTGLHRLYDILMKELQQPGFRSRYSVKNVGLEVDFLILLVEVFHQEAAFGSIDANEHCSSSKRRRTTRGFQLLVDSIQCCGAETEDVVAWFITAEQCENGVVFYAAFVYLLKFSRLQLTDCFLKKYPDVSVSVEDLVTFVQLLHQLQLDCKRYVIMAAILNCLCSVLGAYTCLSKTQNSHDVRGGGGGVNNIWSNIYELCVRTVSLNQCIPEGHSLIQKLIVSGFIQPGSELQCLFVPGLSTLSQHSLCTIANIMEHSNVHRLAPKQRTSDRSASVLDFRLQLLNWLLPNFNGEFNSLVFKGNDRPSITIVCDVLERLTVRDCRKWDKFVQVEPLLEDSLGSLYLKATFDEPLNICDKTLFKSKEVDFEISRCNAVVAVRDKLIECLVRDCDILLDVTQATESNDLVSVSGQCCLVTKCIGQLIRDGSLCITELANLHLCNTLQKLMSRLGVLVRDLCHNEPYSMSKQQTLDMVVSNLSEMFSWNGTLSYCQKMAQFCREMTSEMLVSSLNDCVYGNVFPVSSFHSSNNDPDFDCEHDGDLPDVTNVAFERLFRSFHGYRRFLPPTDISIEDIGEITTAVLTSFERLQLRVAALLTTWCQYPRAPLLSPLRPTAAAKCSAAFSLDDILKRLIRPLLTETFNYERPFNMQLVLTVLFNLMKDGHTLNEKHFEDCLTALKRLCKIYFRDGEICVLCLNLLSKLLLKLNDYYVKSDFEGDLVLRNHAVHLLNGFWVHKSRGNCGPFTELALLKAIAVLGRCDPRFVNNEYVSQGNAEITRIEFPSPFLIPNFLQSENFVVSFHVSHVISVLLQNESTANDFNANRHSDILKSVSASINSSAVAIDGSLKRLDLQNNWTSSSILVLTQMAIFSPFCLKQVLFEIFIHAREIPSSVSLTKKALRHISALFGYDTLSEFLDLHIGCLIYKWIEKDFEFDSCLWKLADLSSLQEFYRKYYTIIVPFVFVYSKTELSESISTALNCPWPDLVKECFPQIMACVLPGHVLSDSVDNLSCYVPSKRTADLCHRNLEKILTREVINEQLASRLDEVVVCLLKSLHGADDDVFFVMPPSNPPSYKLSTVRASLDYIMTACNECNSSLVSVLMRTQDGIQKVLISLEMILDVGREPHDVYRACLAYKLFVSLIWKEFQGGLQSSWAFVLHDVIVTLVHLLNRSTSRKCEILVSECCVLLREITESALNVCQMEISKLITVILNGLVPHVKNGDNSLVGDKALSLINFLVVEAGESLAKNLVYMEPFPDLPAFESAQQKLSALKYGNGQLSLKREIEYFLRGLELNRGQMRIEGFCFLKKSLSSRQDELKELIRGLREVRFSDECSDNVLYHLMVELTHICSTLNSTDKVVPELLRCLGELGPLQFPSIILLPRKSNKCLTSTVNLYEGDLMSQCNVIICHRLHSYLSDPSVKVKVVTSKVLKNVLATESGYKFVNDYKNKKAGLLFSYLHPFCSKKPSQITNHTFEKDFVLTIDTASIWSGDHLKLEEFICNLCCHLIETGSHCCEILNQLKPICEVKLDFCKELLPYLLHSILMNDNTGRFFKIISRQISGFFAKFIGVREENSLLSPSKGGSVPVYVDKRAIGVMLTVVQFLQLQKKPKPKNKTTAAFLSEWNDNFRLDLDYLHVAHAAHFCSAHFSALFFVEIWCEVKTRKLQETQIDSSGSDSSLTQFSSSSPISFLCSNYPDGVQAMQDLLLQIYRSIGDADGIYGCGMSHLSDANTRIRYYEHERRWDKAALAYDLALQSGSCGTSTNVLPTGLHRTLHNLGLQNLSVMYLENISSTLDSAEVRDFQFECAWKTTRWAEPDAGSWVDDTDAVGFNALIYCSLSALRHGDFHSFRDLCNRTYRSVALDLKHKSLECAAGLKYPLTCLLALNNLEDFLPLKESNVVDFFPNLVEKWANRDNIVRYDYDVMEPVLSLRSTLLQILLSSSGTQQQQNIVEAMFKCDELHAQLARKSELLQYAETRIVRLRGMCSVVKHKNAAWRLEEAKIFWDRDEHDTAKSLLNILLKEMDQKVLDKETSKLYAQSLNIYGNWLIETRAENPANITENFLEKSIAILEKNKGNDAETVDLMVSAYVALARYADSHYKRIVDYLKSSAYESKHQMIVGSEQEVNKLRALRKLNMDQIRSFNMLDKQSKIDKKELESMHEDKMKFLLKATENYLKCLEIGTGQDNRVFRLVSLWFQNKDNVDLNAKLKNHLSRIASYKFLPLMYQLAARLGSNAQRYPVFQKILLELIERVVTDHPHHTLLVILALSNASKDQSYLSANVKQAAENKTEDKVRVRSARNLLDRVQRTRLGPLVVNMQKLCDALIALSYMELTDDQKKKENVSFPISSDQLLARIGRLENVPPFTMNIKVDVTCKYDNVATIVEYTHSFKCFGGINHPKQIRCRGSDGVVHIQLVKGNDDLRQDAVMQQVFGMVNTLLRDNPDAACRNLSIRTYTVVPLSQKSGVLEWCQNTIPFGQYLVDCRSSKGAHSRYYPNDRKISQCRTQMTNAAKQSLEEKHKTFLDVCHNLRPVFRHFFFENFPHPPTWYERRMAYVRSVATTSMVGYILGLGDRHVSNILVDKKTAEFVHIDLGIAFEQGRNLQTPETVPFRLTRDVVDGMGITGTEGTFRRCCEKTMTVIRSSQEVVLTILEVLLYDPLYQWSLTPLKACKVQRSHNNSLSEDSCSSADFSSSLFMDNNEMSVISSDQTVNKLAERALHRLYQKLQGIEDGTILSVSGQVSYLIQEAMNTRNLCRIFYGWQPYL